MAIRAAQLLSLVSLVTVFTIGSGISVSSAQTPSLTVWGRHGSSQWSGWTLQGVRSEEDAIVLDQAGEGADVVITGSLESPIQQLAFDELIPSWNARTPDGTWIETLARVRTAGAWTTWYSLGRWSSDSGSGNRRSVKGQDDDRVQILTDTLRVRAGADAYQLRVTLNATDITTTPEVALVSTVATSRAATAAGRTTRSIAPIELDVPERSQMIYPNGGEVWCSPTSTSMVMAYWAGQIANPALDRDVPVVADGTYDPIYRGNGNWPFNTAYAGDAGLTGFVSRGSSLHDVERWLTEGIPVIASLGWGPGQLPEAPIGSTNGHLLVVVGIAENGDVIVNDPAADPRRGQPVRRVYNRLSFESLWLTHSGGTVYLIYPPGHPTPLSV